MSTEINDSVVQAIKDSVATATIAVDEETYFTRPVYDPPADATTDALTLHTLESLAEYVKANADDGLETAIIHVVNETTVKVLSPTFGRFKQRDIYAEATALGILGQGKSDFSYGSFQDPERFIISLQCHFAASDVRKSLLQIVGTIKEESVRTTDDDGVTQIVTAKTGVARVGTVEVPNPVVLSPYRTFREVEQPESPFVLRMQSGPAIALFECDGNQWKLDAIQSIKAFLAGALPERTIIG